MKENIMRNPAHNSKVICVSNLRSALKLRTISFLKMRPVRLCLAITRKYSDIERNIMLRI